MAKQEKKLIFLLKIILGTVFAIEAGRVIAFQAEYSNRDLGSFVPGFVYTFFPLACVVIMQWLLLSEYLPKWWVTLGILGSIVAGIAVGIMFLYIPNEVYNSHNFEIGIFKAFFSGLLAALPQWLLLRSKKGYLWVLANSLGLAIESWRSIFYIPVQEVFFLALARMLILEASVLPLGLMLGLYLYSHVYKPNS